jgi:ectoine hydroxylase-related dioxygenase (phytanoyl-CoA dioxygenase family)
MIPMVGLAGDVVFFDTNVPHKAGMVSNGYERYVLRFDFDLDGLNVKPSIIDRLLKKFYMLCNINQKSR